MRAAAKRLVVLLADDNESDLFILRRIFRRRNDVERLVALSSGDEALAYIEGEARYANRVAWPMPNLLVLDERLPRLSGTDVLRLLRSKPRFSWLPVILLSGGLQPSRIETISQLQAAYCAKVTDPNELAVGIDKALSQALTAVSEISNSPPLVPIPPELRPRSVSKVLEEIRVWT
jgi:CheY-like chemotaxis protein